MTLSFDFIRKKLGWCPNERTMRTAPPVIATPPVIIHPQQPGGGAGGPGWIDRGINLAVGSIKFLIRNRRLFWFSLLTGLVMILSLASSLYLQYISGIMPIPGSSLFPGPAHALIASGSLPWIALTFTTGLICTFLIYYLLAALIACVSLILSGQAATIRDGLAHAGKYLRPLGTWAGIESVIGTVYTYITYSSMMTNGPTENLGLTFIAMALLAVFYVVTMFVVPLIVLGNGNLTDSVMESISLFRKMWREIVVCFFILLLVVFAILLISLVPIFGIAFSSGSTIAVAIFAAGYMLVLLVLMFIGATVLGIAITGLYTYGMTGILSPVFGENKRRVEDE